VGTRAEWALWQGRRDGETPRCDAQGVQTKSVVKKNSKAGRRPFSSLLRILLVGVGDAIEKRARGKRQIATCSAASADRLAVDRGRKRALAKITSKEIVKKRRNTIEKKKDAHASRKGATRSRRMTLKKKKTRQAILTQVGRTVDESERGRNIKK